MFLVIDYKANLKKTHFCYRLQLLNHINQSISTHPSPRRRHWTLSPEETSRHPNPHYTDHIVSVASVNIENFTLLKYHFSLAFDAFHSAATNSGHWP